ncbi:MAG TPA: glucose-6-phosphate isomerase [Gemmatimonadaceae bacterium]
MISIDFTNMMASAVDNGITDAEWEDAHGAFAAIHNNVTAQRNDGVADFMNLPRNAPLLQQSIDFAGRVRGRYDDVVILGIGGSALGPIALKTALCRSGWNELTVEARSGAPRLHVLDNIDPVTIVAVLDRLKLDRTLFIVTSKSGGTAETMSQFLIAHDRVTTAGLAVADHFVFVTDPKNGALRPLAQELSVPALDIPPGVGGRYSVLTPVGTLPAALLGINVRELLLGAGEMLDRCESTELSDNPAGVLGSLFYMSDVRHGRVIDVLMPYSDPLRDFAAWFVQLWAESLGKHRADGKSVGSTPLPALGSTDQHSQVQSFMEGPANKVVAFIAVEDHGPDIIIPTAFPHVTELGYLGGHSLSELLNIEQRATAGALAKRGRSNLTVRIEKVDAHHVGGLMMMFEIATAYAGQMYGVNAFNQPGVELGKQFAYALLGRPGAEAAKAQWDALPKPDPRWSQSR